MGVLKAEAENLLRNSMASQTWRTYQNAEAHFNEFRTKFNLQNSWPIPHDHLINYIAYLSVSGMSASTASTYVSALSYIHKIRNYPDPTKLFIITKVLEGMKRKCKKCDVRSPITFDLLCKLVVALEHTCSSHYESLMFQSAFLLAFHAFLRVSEFTAQNKFDTSDRALKVNDVAISKDGRMISLCIRYSKTDQYCNSFKLSIKSSYNSKVNLISTIQRYLNSRPLMPNQQLFLHYNGAPLTRYQFSAVLKKTLKFCNIETGVYRSHSFRIGAATECASRNIPSEKIKLWGRWTSNAAYNRYIRIPEIIC